MISTTDTKRTYTLKPWDEARGKVQNLEIENNSVFLKFTCGTIINLTMPSEEIVERLQSVVGKEISILRTDIVGKECLIKIEDANEASVPTTKNKKIQAKKSDERIVTNQMISQGSHLTNIEEVL